jgi:23S rRNA (uracil1939-C5)-methyltransferase
MKKPKVYPVIENIEITDAGSEGNSIARVNDIVAFVEHAVPGDIADIEVYRKKKNFIEARAVRINKPSVRRTDPFCEHFGVCGGCRWQNMKYESQLHYKQKQVEEALRRIGKVEIPALLPIIGSEKTKFYRNKLEYTFSDKRWLTEADMHRKDEITDREALGYHLPGRFDKVLDIRNCYLQEEPSNSIRLEVKSYAIKHGITFFNIREQHGLLRNLIIRNSLSSDLMVIVIFFRDEKEIREGLLNHLISAFPTITSLMYVINPKKNDSIADLEVKHFYGKDCLLEKMEDLEFKISPKSFYQTNSEQAYRLYSITREFASVTKQDIVYDLYTGTGTIANFVARHAGKVIGIEYIEAAIKDAKENSKINKIENTAFYAGDIKDVLNDQFIESNGRPEVIITDPPRAGMHEDVTRKILEISPGRIVYVSCNPATQARDISILAEKYSVEKVQPVDMFPHTHHVENVVLLKLRSHEHPDN